MKNSKKKIAIIYTGGTIGMVPSDQGYIPSPNSFYKILDEFQDMHHPNVPDWELIELSPLLDSSDITVKEWNKIGRIIRDNYLRFDGFVILHGTDTMAYSASALSFMLENLNKPVVFTGSQIPLCELRSDGRDNIINSVVIAASNEIHEVCLYFHGKLLRGNCSTKASSDQFEAFVSPNAPLLADVGISIQYNHQAIRPSCPGIFRLQELKKYLLAY